MSRLELGPALLFCPADRPDRYEKALAAADGVIVDLEDAVAADRKAAARQALLDHPLDPARVIVRVNAADTADFAEDLAAVRDTDYRRVMLPKAEHAEQFAALAGYDVIALCETPLGVLEAPSIASVPAVVALMWGAEDLVAGIGGRSSRFDDGSYRSVALHARSRVLLAAAARGRQAIDTIYADMRDLAGLAAESDDAAASGFDFKACIHPTQAEVVRGAYRPSEERLAQARRILEAMAGGGVQAIDGQMIDGPLIRQAEQTLADWIRCAG